jgi:hypothetical protein
VVDAEGCSLSAVLLVVVQTHVTCWTWRIELNFFTFLVRSYFCLATFADQNHLFTVQWEGPEAHREFIDVVHDNDDPSPKEPARLPTPPPALPPSESEEDPDSEDEYVAEPEAVNNKGLTTSLRVCTCAAHFGSYMVA